VYIAGSETDPGLARTRTSRGTVFSRSPNDNDRSADTFYEPLAPGGRSTIALVHSRPSLSFLAFAGRGAAHPRKQIRHSPCLPQGRIVIGVSLSVGASKIGSLASHKGVALYVFPGYHELTRQSGEISPSALFKTEAGGEYFFRLEYEQVVASTSLRGSILSLSMQPRPFCRPTPRKRPDRCAHKSVTGTVAKFR
jgi:hypothetical protein